MNVFALMYGSVDVESEVTQQLYMKHDDAVNAAELSVHAIFDEDPALTEEGFSYDMTTDSNGDTVVIISKDGKETEWWRVVERPVY